jgi:hypothetical protein
MPKLVVFNNVTLDGYFAVVNGDFRRAEKSSCATSRWREGGAHYNKRLLTCN